ncbi:MAG: DUF4259 domain-containing protein [Pseudomonadota bacterium]
MSAWGPQPFQNHGAGDFEAELVHGAPGDITLLRRTLQATATASYIESDLGGAAVAAAALVAWLAGAKQVEVPQRVLAWQAAGSPRGVRPLVPLALQALDAVTANADRSELCDLWQATDDFNTWQNSVSALREALQKV